MFLLADFFVLSANGIAENISIESGRFKLVLSSDGYAVDLVGKDTGKSIAAINKGGKEYIFSADLIKRGIGIPVKDSDQNGTRSKDLKYIQLEDDILLVSADKNQLPRFTFSVAGRSHQEKGMVSI